MTPYLNRLNETVLMMGHKMFYGEICLIIISELPLLPLLIWSTNSQSYSQKSTLAGTLEIVSIFGVIMAFYKLKQQWLSWNHFDCSFVAVYVSNKSGPFAWGNKSILG